MTETYLSVVNNGSQQYVRTVVDNEGNCDGTAITRKFTYFCIATPT